MIPKLSIVIPMYNESRYIGRCLESFKKQTFKDFEIILIDDGSIDNTIEIAEKFSKDFQLKILKQNHGGPGKARNLGANEATGEILIFVDADMFFDEKFLEELTEPIIKGEEIGTAHGVELVGNLENKLARAWSINRIPNPPKRSGVYRAILKNIFLEAGGFDSSKGYFDDDLSKINNGNGALTVMEAICYHNNPENIKEIIKHSTWVGKSLFETGKIIEYIKIYKNLLILFGFFGLIVFIFLIYKGFLLYSILSIFGLMFIFIFYKSIQKIIKEKYLSHLIFVPIVIINRCIGYGIGIGKFILKIK